MLGQARHHLKAKRSIFNVARDRPDMIERPGQGMDVVTRHGIVSWLEAHDAAAGCRLAYRTAGAGANCHGGKLRSNGGGRTAAGAAGNATRKTRIQYMTEMRIRAVDAKGEFMQIRRAYDQRAGCAQSRHHRSIALLNGGLDCAGAGRHRISGYRHEVFHADGHSGERPGIFTTFEPKIERARLFQYTRRTHRNERIQMAVRPDAREEEFGDLGR